MAPLRILLFGAGSIGSVYTYILSQTDAEVTTVCRSNYSAASSNGFTIKALHRGETLTVKPTVIKSPTDATGEYDYVVLCSKAMPGSKPSTAELIKPAVRSGTTIVLIQNGIGIEEEYRELFPENPILSCVVYLPVTQIEPGIIEQYASDTLQVGTYPSAVPDEHKTIAKNFVDLVKAGGGTEVLFEDDVQLARWDKLLLNVSWNPICALSRLRDAQFLKSSPEASTYVRNVMMEVASIAQAVGYPEIGREKIEVQMARAEGRSQPGIQPSMMSDALAGRVMEVEAIVGNTVRIARKYEGLRVPLIDSLYFLIKGLDVGMAMNRAART